MIMRYQTMSRVKTVVHQPRNLANHFGLGFMIWVVKLGMVTGLLV